MLIKHTLVRDGKTISGRITETIFEGDEKRGDEKEIKIGNNFSIMSTYAPALALDMLYVYGTAEDRDYCEVSQPYETEERAIEVMEAIESVTVKEEKERQSKEGDVVLVRDYKDDEREKNIFIFETKLNGDRKYITKVNYEYSQEKSYSRKQMKKYEPTTEINGKEYLLEDIEKLTPVE